MDDLPQDPIFTRSNQTPPPCLENQVRIAGEPGLTPKPSMQTRLRPCVIWSALSIIVLCWLGYMLSNGICRPWVNFIDYNGAVWSQAAHNILRAGVLKTEGASSGFYFGALPIPPRGYYLHHPPLLHLLLAGIFHIFGEHEWAARLLPISCSIISGLFLWFLVRSCLGARSAAFSLAVFACLPMELRYGQMVNFEPLVLMLVLGGLVSLRLWKTSGKTAWKVAAMSAFMIGLWVDWAMYLFLIVLCGYWFYTRDSEAKRMARVLTVFGLISAAVYFIRIRLIRPDAWDSLIHAFFCRMGSEHSGSGSSIHFTEAQWLSRIADSLSTHFLPMGLALAVLGGLFMFRKRHQEEMRWLIWTCLLVSAMDLIFVGGFQNDSYIHPYIAFYLVAPVSIASGVAFNEITSYIQKRHTATRFHLFAAIALLCILFHSGTAQADKLRRQFLVLDFKRQEPSDLIPTLGAAIRKNFTPNTDVICNFLPVYGPQLGYYAQRNLLNNVQDYRFWRTYLQNPLEKNIGGVVWLNSEKAREIVSNLPAGTKNYIRLGDTSFCFWKPCPTISTISYSIPKANERSTRTRGT